MDLPDTTESLWTSPSSMLQGHARRLVAHVDPKPFASLLVREVLVRDVEDACVFLLCPIAGIFVPPHVDVAEVMVGPDGSVNVERGVGGLPSHKWHYDQRPATKDKSDRRPATQDLGPRTQGSGLTEGTVCDLNPTGHSLSNQHFEHAEEQGCTCVGPANQKQPKSSGANILGPTT